MSTHNYPGESGVIHRICEFDGRVCELGMLAASLAEDINLARVTSNLRLEALADVTASAILQRSKVAIANTPALEPYLNESTSSIIESLRSVVPELFLCRAVCEGHRRILGCGVKTVES